MKIAVVFYRTLSSQSSASLSAGYLTAHLRNNGHDVDMFLLVKGQGIPFKSNYDVVFYKPNFKDVREMPGNLKFIKDKNPKSKIILFGPLAFINRHYILDNNPLVDKICKPDSEYYISNYLSGDKDIFITRDNQGNEAKGDHVYDVWPARDIEMSEDIKIVNIEASRGCHNRCSFCHVGLINSLVGGKVQSREIDDLISEIRSLADKGKRYFIFNDPVLGGSLNPKDWILEFCDKIKKQNLDVFFMAYLTLKDISDEQLIEKMSQANFIRVFVGIESVNSDSLNMFNKYVPVIEYNRIKNLLYKYNMTCHIGYMLFHPYCTKSELISGLGYLREHAEIHRFGVVYEPTRVIYDTPIYHSLKKDGLLDENGMDISFKFVNKNMGKTYNRFRRIMVDIDVPLFERIEYLFVTSQFISVLFSKIFNSELSMYEEIERIYSRYSELFYNLCIDIWEEKEICVEKQHAIFFALWQKLEIKWDMLIAGARDQGMADPLEWIANGSYSYESKTLCDPLETRSGKIRVL